MLNTSGSGQPARLRYLSGSYHVVAPGDYVVCAVSGERIPLADLRYWSSEFQEAYKNAEAAVARHSEMRAKGRI
jgi:hypothetical protein